MVIQHLQCEILISYSRCFILRLRKDERRILERANSPAAKHGERASFRKLYIPNISYTNAENTDYKQLLYNARRS